MSQPQQIRPGRLEPVWTIERHSGRRLDKWRQVFSGNKAQAGARFDRLSDKLRQGGVRLIQPDGKPLFTVNAPRLRTRW